jgi:hypothetical protein
MTVLQEISDKWKALRSAGDATKIVERAAQQGIKTSEELVNRAIRIGKVNDDLFKVIGDFFNEKAEMIKKYV